MLVTTFILSSSVFAQANAKKDAKENHLKKPIDVSEVVEIQSPSTASTKSVDEADQAITNRLLRASAGSLSRWSGNFNINYNGGSVAKPLAAQRPNINDGADSLTLQYMNANVGFRYRLNPLNSLTVATGVFMTTPFNTTIKTNDPALRDEFKKTRGVLTANDPNLIYTNLMNFGGYQFVNTVTPTLITNSQQRHQGYRASGDVSSTMMKVVNGSNLSLGLALEWTGYSYDKTYGQSKGLATNVWQSYPIAEYIINDWLNLRTLVGWPVYQQTRQMKPNNYTQRIMYQSFGTGISVTRDIFLYPNIQFIPADIRADRTNIGLSAYVNTF
jgi:hypothetical protein